MNRVVSSLERIYRKCSLVVEGVDIHQQMIDFPGVRSLVQRATCVILVLGVMKLGADRSFTNTVAAG